MEPSELTTIPAPTDRCKPHRHGRALKIKDNLLSCLGPGLIAGASDDDPSGIATYSQAGAAYGYSMLWIMLLTLPLMVAIQEIAARIGRVTGRGLARNMRLHYHPALVWSVVSIMVLANILNLGADIGAMGESAALLLHTSRSSILVYAILLTGISLLLQILLSYRRYTAILRYLALILALYLLTAFFVHADWRAVLHHTFLPTIQFNAPFIALLVGVLGTTISPYLFFWQASLESEHVKVDKTVEPLTRAPEQARHAFARIRSDTLIGMCFSNLVAYAIILCAAATLFASSNGAGVQIDSAAQAAKALQPLAGNFASTLFALGIIGGGLLALPSLAGSAAYAIAELLKWPAGLDRKPGRARGFYGVLAGATGVSIGIVLSPINPIKALVWSAVLNGLAAVPVMIMVMLMFANPKVMGGFSRISKPLKTMGWIATALMAAGALTYFITLLF